MGRTQSNNPRRNTDSSFACGYIAQNYTVGADSGTVSYLNFSQELGAGTDIDTLTQDRCRTNGKLSDRDLLHDDTIVTNDCVFVDDDAIGVRQKQPLTNFRVGMNIGTGDDTTNEMLNNKIFSRQLRKNSIFRPVILTAMDGIQKHRTYVENIVHRSNLS